MASNQIVEALRQVAIFRDLQPAQLAELARHTERIKFAAGDAITRAGEAGSGAYLLVSGAAERLPEPGRAEPPEALAPGSLIGQLAMLIEHAYGSSIVARERVFCLKITRAGILAQMAADPPLAQHFERHVTNRLLTVAKQLREIDSLLQARKPGTSLGRSVRAIAAAGGSVHAWHPRRPGIADRPRSLARLRARRSPIGSANEKRPTPGEELGAKARYAHCAGREAGTASDVFRLDGGHYR